MNSRELVAISDHRFHTPFDENDHFHPLTMEEGSIDLFRLKSEAERRAHQKIDEVHRTFGDDAEKTFSFLKDRRYRKGPNAFINDSQAVHLQHIRQTIQREQRLHLVISCMPVKARHPLKSFSKTGSEIDIGDVGTLLRMYEIGYGASRLHPFGVKVKILSDGARYQDIFGFDAKEHQSYRANLQKVIDHLGLGSYVELIDEEKLYPPDFENIRQRCHEDIQKLFQEGSADICDLVTQLQPSITLSLPIDSSIPHENVAAAFNTHISDDELSARYPHARNIRSSLSQKSIPTVLQYIAANRAVAECDIYGKLHALRMTVHPKPAQIGLHLVNQATEIFPYHGQGVLKPSEREHISLEDVRVRFAADILRENNGDQYRGIVLSPKKYPFSDGKHPFAICSRFV